MPDRSSLRLVAGDHRLPPRVNSRARRRAVETAAMNPPRRPQAALIDQPA